MNNMSMMPDDENQMPPELSKLLTTINTTPPTDYSFYKDISAEDRAKLAQDIMAKQRSGANLAASALGGIGDAISNSFGGKNTSFQKDIKADMQAKGAQELNNFDTQRAQKMQDFQANTTGLEQDPSSPLSKQGRDFFISNGVQVPSGMNFSQLKTLAPAMADIVKGKWEQSFRDAQLASQNSIAEQAAKDRGLQIQIQQGQAKRQEDKDMVDASEKAKDQKMHALEARSKVGWTDRIFNPEVQQALDQEAGLAPTKPLLKAFDDEKEKRYQAWKAKQGR